jgi:hypothetical protein
MFNLNTTVEAIRDAASRLQQTVQMQLDEKKELASLTEEQRDELQHVEALVNGELMSSWTQHQNTSPTGEGKNVYFSMSPAADRFITVGHAVSPHTDNHYIRVTQKRGTEIDLLVMMQSLVAQRLFEILADRAKTEGTSRI